VRRADGESVAIKILRHEYLADPTVVARFVRESTTLRELSHPHLVPVDDLVSEDSTLAVVMPLVNGDDLRHILQRGGLDARRAVTLLAQVARALTYIHAAGILHRDVKPENILVTRRAGQPWALLTDFGLAWVADGQQLTRSTQMLGTPAYVAPELMAGRPYGPAVDVYALGVTAYELLAGRRPFDGDHPLAVMRAHLDDEPQRPADMAKDLWRIVRACLAKRPEDRPSAESLAHQLESLRGRRRVRPASPALLRSGHVRSLLAAVPRRHWTVLVTGLVLGGLVAALAVGWPQSPGATSPTTTAFPGQATGTPRPPSPAPSGAQTPTATPTALRPSPTVWPLTPATGPIIGPGGDCLDDQSSQTTNGNPVQSWMCNDSAAQLWTVGVDGTLRVVSRCLRAAGTAEGAAVHIWACDGTAVEQWQVRAGGGLVNVASGRCLASTGKLAARPVLRTCNGSTGQRWRLPK
jgi:serine/threonine protein kinase